MMYDRLKELLLEALPVELGGRPLTPQEKMRSKVLSNIEASKAARSSSTFGEKRKQAVQAAKASANLGVGGAAKASSTTATTSNGRSANLQNAGMRAKLLANLRASRASRSSSNFGEFSRSQDAIAAYKAKEAEKQKQAAISKVSGAVKSLAGGALAGKLVGRTLGLQGATKRKAAPGSLV